MEHDIILASYEHARELLPGIYALGKALWLKTLSMVVIADLHIGYEEALNKEGFLMPRQQFRQTTEELEKLFKITGKVNSVIVLGDLKHEFGEISKQEWFETFAVLDLLAKNSKEIILIKGNHDTILEPIAKRKNLEIKEIYFANNIVFWHGHKFHVELVKARTIIAGHMHPAISLYDGVKSELYKCFLLGKWKGKNLVIMPSFLPIVEGMDVLRSKELWLDLNFNINSFNAYVIADRIYDFGKLREIARRVGG